MKFIVFFIIIVILILLRNKINNNFSNVDTETYVETDGNGWIEKYFDKVVVITLPKREKNVKKVMGNLKIKAEIFEAVKKDKLKLEELKRDGIITKDCNLNNGRIACHLSHLSVMDEFLNDPNSERMLIFEDDLLDNGGTDLANVQSTIKNVMNNIPDDWDLIYFGKCWDLCNKSIEINDYVNKSYPLCRHGYAVSKKGASKILKYCFPMPNKNGDNMIRELSLEGKINIYTPKNNIFEQNREKFGSNLENHSRIRLCADVFSRLSYIAEDSKDFFQYIAYCVKNNLEIFS